MSITTEKEAWEAVRKDGWSLHHVPEELKTYKLCLAAIKQQGLVLRKVPKALRTPELCLAAVKEYGLAFRYVPKALKTPELCLIAVKDEGTELRHVPEALKTPKLCLAAVKHDPWGCALNHVPEALKTYELCLAAVKQNEEAIICVPKGLMAKIKAATQPGRGKACLAPLAVPTKTAKGKFTDPRDGKVYKTVKIGKQVWFAENLNFDCKGSKCYDSYDNDPENAEESEYGRLYDWKTAKKACPPGWHLPSKEEWDELVDFAGGEKRAGKKLKAKSGWNGYQGYSGNGTDKYCFSALPGGSGDSDGNFYDAGDSGSWWSASEDEHNSSDAYYCGIHYEYENAYGCYLKKNDLFSVRCVQDKVLPKGIRRGKKK